MSGAVGGEKKKAGGGNPGGESICFGSEWEGSSTPSKTTRRATAIQSAGEPQSLQSHQLEKQQLNKKKRAWTHPPPPTCL
jgi:hypothetical protein